MIPERTEKFRVYCRELGITQRVVGKIARRLSRDTIPMISDEAAAQIRQKDEQAREYYQATANSASVLAELEDH